MAKSTNKRKSGEGTLRQKPDGRWECRLMIGRGNDGRPRFKYLSAMSQRALRDKIRAWREDEASGIDWEANFTFSEWADIWYEGHKDNIAATTQESYRYTLRILKDHFCDRKLNGIKAYDIEEFLKKLRREGASKSRMAGCRGMLYQIFHKAEANDLIHKNPVRFADKMRNLEPGTAKESFTAEEVKLLMANLPQNRIGASIRLMLGTGMRSQELLALEPKFIAEDGSVIQIRQAINMVKGTATIGTPKSRDSYRDIPVPATLRPYALFLRNTDKMYIWEGGIPNKPCNPSHFRSQYKAAVEAIEGVRYLSPHSCRHTYVSQMQALGVDLSTIQSIVGHADLDMTKHYLHVQDPIRQAAVQKFSDAFAVDGEPNTMDSTD